MATNPPIARSGGYEKSDASPRGLVYFALTIGAILAATCLSLIWLFGLGYVCSVWIGVLSLHKLWRIASGRIGDAELVQVRESAEPDSPAELAR